MEEAAGVLAADFLPVTATASLSIITSVSPTLSLGPAAVCVCYSETVSSVPKTADYLLSSLTLTAAVSSGTCY